MGGQSKVTMFSMNQVRSEWWNNFIISQTLYCSKLIIYRNQFNVHPVYHSSLIGEGRQVRNGAQCLMSVGLFPRGLISVTNN